MKQEKPIFNLESHHLSDDELQALLECLDTGEDQAEEDDDDSDEIDPFSGIPINSKMGYEPYTICRRPNLILMEYSLSPYSGLFRSYSVKGG